MLIKTEVENIFLRPGYSGRFSMASSFCFPSSSFLRVLISVSSFNFSVSLCSLLLLFLYSIKEHKSFEIVFGLVNKIFSTFGFCNYSCLNKSKLMLWLPNIIESYKFSICSTVRGGKWLKLREFNEFNKFVFGYWLML